MSEELQDIVVEVEAPPAPDKGDGDKVVRQEESPVDNLQKQLAKLKEETDAERTRNASVADEAKRNAEEARKARDDAAKLRQNLQETNVSLLDNAILAAQTDADGLQRQQEAAFSAGNFSLAAELGRKMAKAEARVAQLEAGKSDLEHQIKTQPKEEEKKPEPVKTAADPFEAAVQNLTPRTQDWFRAQRKEGRDFVGDPKLNAKAAAAHYKAVSEGYTPDTDAYFEYCETELGLRTPKKHEQIHEDTAARPLHAAPVSRETSPQGGQLSPTQVKLTPNEARAAQDGTHTWNYDDPQGKFKRGEPIGVKEFARRKAIMEKQGFYDRGNYAG